MTAPTTDLPADQEVTAGDAADQQTGGMIALIPADPYLQQLAVPGGDDPSELHLTVVYLGDDVTGWPDDQRRNVVEMARNAATRRGDENGMVRTRAFGHAIFNPDGYADRTPVAVYLIGDSDQLRPLRDELSGFADAAQHEPFIPHITAGQDVSLDALSYTGPVLFDRLRVALGGDITDIPIGSNGSIMGDSTTFMPMDDMTAAVTTQQRDAAAERGNTYPGTDKFPVTTRDQFASAVKLAGKSSIPAEKVRRWLIRKAQQKGWTDLIPDTWKSDGTLTATAQQDPEWISAITAAATALLERLGAAEAYRQAPLVFSTPESIRVADLVIEPPAEDPALIAAAGDATLPPIGYFTPPPDLPPGVGHYVDHEPIDGVHRRVYGRLAEWNVPHIGIDGREVYPPRNASGYRWFHTKSAWVQGPNGPERLKVGHLTFGLGHASTDPSVSYLAAAAHYDNSRYRGAKVRMSEDEHGPVYAGVTVAGLEGDRLEEFSESDTSGDWRRIMGRLELVAALCVNVGGFPKVGLSLAASGEVLAMVASAKAWGHTAGIDYNILADTIAARIEQRQAVTAALQSRRTALLAELDDREERFTELLADLYCDDDEIYSPAAVTDDASTAVTDDTSLIAANWVEKAGGLPSYIKRIVKHLRQKGMNESRAIATAVNVAKKMCSTGDTNWPGLQHVNSGSRAEACAAVAHWERMKARSKG